MRVVSRGAAFVMVLLVCAAIPAAFPWLAGFDPVRTDDHNGDGRPDVWRRYDRQGRLVERSLDTNFDGRSDVREYYDGGILVRRESDRNFDDRIDLVEEFDRGTLERARLVADTDFDGTADLLELFRDGRVVFSRTLGSQRTSLVSTTAPQRGQGADPLAGMSDPFARELTVRTTGPFSSADHSAGWTGESSFVCSGLISIGGRLAVAGWLSPTDTRSFGSSPRAVPSRGPPSSARTAA